MDAAKRCLEKFPKIDSDFGPVCKPTWDKIMCWPPALPGSTLRLPCPGTEGKSANVKFASRVCGHDGQWLGQLAVDKSINGWTNFSECVIPEETITISSNINLNESRDTWNMSLDTNLTKAEHSIGAIAIIHESVDVIAAIFLTISFILILASFVILFCLKTFNGTRVRIYRNIFLAFLLHDVMELVIRFGRALHFHDVVNGGDTCVALGVFVASTSAAIHTWLAMSSLYYLLTSKGIVVKRKMYLVICLLGWFIPAILTITWLMVSVLKGDLKCWYGELYLSRLEHSFWVLEAPKAAMMLLAWIFMTCFFVVYSSEKVQRHHPQEKNLMVELQGIKRNGIKMMFILAYVTVAYLLYMVYIQISSSEEFAYAVATVLFSRGIVLSIVLCFSETDVRYNYDVNEEEGN